MFDKKEEKVTSTIGLPESSINGLSNIGLTSQKMVMIQNLTRSSDLFSLSVSYNALPIQNGSMENVVLQSGKLHVFQSNLTENVPVAISMKISGDEITEQLKMTIVDPADNVYSNTLSLSNGLLDLQTILPVASGWHVFILEPLSGNLVLEKLEIIDGLSPLNFDTGISEKINGTATTLKLYAYNSTFPLSMMQMGGLTYIPNELHDYSRPVDLFGQIRIRVLSPSLGMFGIELSNTLSFLSTSNVFVAVEISPPNENDPFVKGEKERLGLPEGFIAEYSFWVNENEIPLLPSTTTQIEPFPSGNDNIYRYSSLSDFLPILNATSTAVQASFYSLDTGDLSLINVGSLETHPGSLKVLPAGDYVVLISDPSNSANSFEMNILNANSLSVDSLAKVSLQLNQTALFKLPSPSISFDLLRATYLDHLNLSVSFTFSMYNSLGQKIVSHSKHFDQYASLTDPFYASDNRTQFGPALSQNLVNHTVGNSWLLVTYVGNTVWNSSVSIPTAIANDNTSYGATLQIERFDYWTMKEKRDPSSFHVGGSLFNDFSDPLNASASEIVYRLTFDLTDGGNYIGIRTANHSFIGYILQSTNEEIIKFVPQQSSVNGTTYYSADFYYPGFSGVTYGFILAFNYSSNPPSADGILDINIERIQPKTLVLDFPTLTTVKFKEIATKNPELNIETTTSSSPSSPEAPSQTGNDFN